MAGLKRIHDAFAAEKKTRQRLNRAAPDLLAACKLALSRLERLGAEEETGTERDDYGQYPTVVNVGICPACEALRQAIAAAEGK